MGTPAKTESATGRRWRSVGRWGVLVGAVVLAWPWREESATSVVLPALSPFVAFCSTVANRSVGSLALLALPVLVLALLSPRWFCRHACPTGLLQETVQQLRPANGTTSWRIPAAGRWLVALTVGGACLGYPLFLWLDPLALFNGFLNAWRQPLAAASFVAGVGLPVLLVFGLIFPRAWCQQICPLGASQELLAWPRQFVRQRNRGPAPTANGLPGPVVARRLFLGGCAGAAGALVLGLAREKASRPLRPPGALHEAQFTGVCIRCGNCAQACPTDIIWPDFGASGLAGWVTPMLRFDDNYCREDCHQCGLVCPSGALKRLGAARKREAIIGFAKVDLNTCLLANGRECTACIKHCPYKALVMHSLDGGFSNEPRLNLAACNGCGACESVCPVRPQRAVRVMPA